MNLDQKTASRLNKNAKTSVSIPTDDVGIAREEHLSTYAMNLLKEIEKQVANDALVDSLD